MIAISEAKSAAKREKKFMKKNVILASALLIGLAALTYVTFQSLSGIDDDIFATNFDDNYDLDD